MSSYLLLIGRTKKFTNLTMNFYCIYSELAVGLVTVHLISFSLNIIRDRKMTIQACLHIITCVGVFQLDRLSYKYLVKVH
jgi:hypothetical protein